MERNLTLAEHERVRQLVAALENERCPNCRDKIREGLRTFGSESVERARWEIPR